MMRSSRHAWLLIAALIFAGCAPSATPSPSAAPDTIPIIRVRLLEGVAQAAISATANPIVSIGNQYPPRELIFPHNGAVTFARTATGWQIGGLNFPDGVMTLTPGAGGTLAVNQASYRGSLQFVPTAAGFDVVNDVPIDDYLQGVLPSELYHDWQLQTYEAQAVVARTYALYHAHTDGLGRYWDVYPDQRSQMYGGLAAETDKSRLAVAQTAGLVLTYGPGDGKIFEAYFSSDCGGVSQSAVDAFGGPDIPPLAARAEPGCGKSSPHFNWGPIIVSKSELTRRLRLWGLHHDISEAEMGDIWTVELMSVNPFGRPTRFKVTDSRGATFVLSAESMRDAVNTDAPPQDTLPSSFCKVSAPPNQDMVVFYDGHGSGHGVGMCQWCAQERALAGQPYEEIVLSAYPQAKLERAY